MGELLISWSGLRRWEECRHKHLRYIQGKVSRTMDGRIFLPGTVADRVMREWLASPDPQPGQMEDAVEAMMERFANPQNEDDRKTARVIKWRGDPREDRAKVTEFVRDTVVKLEPILLEYVIPHDYEEELSFRTTIGIPYLDGRTVGVTLLGGIDIVTRLRDAIAIDAGRTLFAPGEFVLYDLKATSDEKYVSKVVGQAIFYDIAFGHWWGDPRQPRAFGFISPATNERLIWVKIDDAARRAMMERIIRFAHGMWRGEWEPKVSNTGCSYCECKHACDKFALHTKPGEEGRRRASFETAASRRTLKHGGGDGRSGAVGELEAPQPGAREAEGEAGG